MNQFSRQQREGIGTYATLGVSFGDAYVCYRVNEAHGYLWTLVPTAVGNHNEQFRGLNSQRWKSPLSPGCLLTSHLVLWV